MAVLPPGPRHILRNLPLIVTPPAVVILGAFATRRLCDTTVPFWLLLLASVLSFPLSFIGYRGWCSLRTRRRAAAACADLPPYAHWDKTMVQLSDENKFFRTFLFQLCQKFGNYYMLSLYLYERFFTTEPEHIKAILATNFTSFQKGEAFREQMQSLLGVGVFNADDELWKFHRSMTRPFFSKDRISHFEIFDRHAADALSQMKARMREGHAVDWQDLVWRFTLDSATEFLLGKDACSLSAGLPYPPTSEAARTSGAKAGSEGEFSQAFSQALIACALRNRYQDAWPIMEFWQDLVEAQKSAIDNFIQPILTNALRQKAERASSASEDEKVSDEDTLMSHLLKATDDYNMIRDETVNILLAGRDTTACALTFSVYRLSEHPDVFKRLREEILSVVGPTRRPTYDDIRNMKYLRAVINETLRLYPPVPINIRCAAKDTVLPPTGSDKKGTFIAAGTKCIYSVFLMHRRKDLWGPDALKFDPDRFLDERLQKYLTHNPFIFLPFNAGPRICLGQQFAYNEVSFMLVRLLQQVSSIEFTPEVSPESVVPPGYTDSPGSDGSDRAWIGSHLTLFAKGGLWVKMTDASNE
ncbi:cytochrome P450 monooxygenase pc-2 [Daedaleopsis nitida]|nr:cytochrome P450 monooxygenase pc-2 [Daedaleopsis nitida]